MYYQIINEHNNKFYTECFLFGSRARVFELFLAAIGFLGGRYERQWLNA